MVYQPRPAANSDSTASSGVPAIRPALRHQRSVQPVNEATDRPTPVDNYQPGQRVWVWHNRSWRPGVALLNGGDALLVRYRYGDDEGTAVDTVPADRIRQRVADA